MVKGIGPVYAKKLVEKFGEKIFDTSEQESARLGESDRIGPKRRQRIKDAWSGQKVSPAVRQLYSWACLHSIPARYQLDMARRRRARVKELILTPVGLG